MHLQRCCFLFFSAPRGPDGAAQQMEKIAVMQGPVASRLHLFQGPALETASCGGRVRGWKETFSCPVNLTPLLRMNQKRNTLVKQKESERGKESEPKSETSCLEVPHLYYGAAAHARSRVQVWHNQTLNLPLQEYQRCSAKVFFFQWRGYVKLPSCFWPF